MRTLPRRPPRSTSRSAGGNGDDTTRHLLTGRAMARAWSLQVDERRRQSAAWSFITETIHSYLLAQGEGFPAEHIAYVTAYQDRSGAPFKKTVDALAWGSYAWFVSEPEGLVKLTAGATSL